jgi:hypothetical protein
VFLFDEILTNTLFRVNIPSDYSNRERFDMSKKSFEERLQAALANTDTLPELESCKEIGEEETSLGTISPGIQGVITLSTQIGEEFNSMLEASMRDGHDVSEETQLQISQLSDQAETLRSLFWCMLKAHIDTKTTGIAIRKGWQVVSFSPPKSQEPSMAEMMAEVMGGDGMPDGIMVVSVSGRRGRGPFGLF